MAKDVEFFNEELECEIEWAKVFKPEKNPFEKRIDEYHYSVVAVLTKSSDRAAFDEICKKHGLKTKVRNPSTDELMDRVRNDRIQFKSNAHDKDGNLRHMPVKDAKMNDWKRGPIGNGSRAVLYLTVSVPSEGNKSIFLTGLQVIDFKEPTGGVAFKPRNGYVQDMSQDQVEEMSDDEAPF